MELEKKQWNEVLVNELTKTNQVLAYINYIESIKNYNLKPETEEEFKKNRVCQCFNFDEIIDIKKENYIKEKKELVDKKELIVFVFFVVFILCIFLFFLLFYIFNK